MAEQEIIYQVIGRVVGLRDMAEPGGDIDEAQIFIQFDERVAEDVMTIRIAVKTGALKLRDEVDILIRKSS